MGKASRSKRERKATPARDVAALHAAGKCTRCGGERGKGREMWCGNCATTAHRAGAARRRKITLNSLHAIDEALG